MHNEYLFLLAQLARPYGGAPASAFRSLIYTAPGDVQAARYASALAQQLQAASGYTEQACFALSSADVLHRIHAQYFSAGLTAKHLASASATRESTVKLAAAIASAHVRDHAAQPGPVVIAAAAKLLGKAIPGPDAAAEARARNFRYLTRHLKVTVAQGLELMRHALRRIGGADSAYVSAEAYQAYVAMQKDAQQYLAQQCVIDRWFDKAYTLDSLAVTAAARSASLLTRIKGVNDLATAAGLHALLVTLTLPPSWHSNPKYGKNSYTGGLQASPAAGVQQLQNQFARFLDYTRRAVGQLIGLKVFESHKDGTPHLHALVYYPAAARSAVLQQLCNAVGIDFVTVHSVERTPCGAKTTKNGIIYDEKTHNYDATAGAVTTCHEPQRLADVRLIDPVVATASSYVSKYVVKHIQAHDYTTHSPVVAAAAHASLWRYRQFAFFGLKKLDHVYQALRKLLRTADTPELAKRCIVVAKTTALTAAPEADAEAAKAAALAFAAETAGQGNYAKFAASFGVLATATHSFKLVRETVTNAAGIATKRTTGVLVTLPSHCPVFLPTCDLGRFQLADPADKGDVALCAALGVDIADI